MIRLTSEDVLDPIGRGFPLSLVLSETDRARSNVDVFFIFLVLRRLWSLFFFSRWCRVCRTKESMITYRNPALPVGPT